MADPFEVREARADEYEAAGEICVLAYAALEGEADLGDYERELRGVALRAEAVPVLVAAEPDGRLLGTVTYVPGPGPYAESESADEASFRMLAVAPWAQGRGIGRALVAECVRRARSDGRSAIAILTRPTMKAAHHIYESIGFVRIRPLDVEFRSGEWLWAYKLAL